MRKQSLSLLTRYFRPCQEILELGCGTGDECIYLAKKGITVTAIDISSKMIDVAEKKARSAGVGDLVKFKVLSIENIGKITPQSFDGVYSSFGPLNCIINLPSFADRLSIILRPHSIFISTILNKYYLMEIAYFLLKRLPTTAIRRWKADFIQRQGIPPSTVSCRYYTPREYFHAFHRHFKLMELKALCVVMPPPYLEPFYSTHPRIGNFLAFIDRFVSSLPLLKAWGDHFILVCQKTG